MPRLWRDDSFIWLRVCQGYFHVAKTSDLSHVFLLFRLSTVFYIVDHFLFKTYWEFFSLSFLETVQPVIFFSASFHFHFSLPWPAPDLYPIRSSLFKALPEKKMNLMSLKDVFYTLVFGIISPDWSYHTWIVNKHFRFNMSRVKFFVPSHSHLLSSDFPDFSRWHHRLPSFSSQKAQSP